MRNDRSLRTNKLRFGSDKKSRSKSGRIHVHVSIQASSDITLRQLAGRVLGPTNQKAIDYYKLYERIDPSISEKISSLSDLHFLKEALQDFNVSIYSKEKKQVLGAKVVDAGDYVYLLDLTEMLAVAVKHPDYAIDVFALTFALGNIVHHDWIEQIALSEIESTENELFGEENIDFAKKIHLVEKMFSILSGMLYEKVAVDSIVKKWANYNPEKYYEYEKDEKNRWIYPHQNGELFLLFKQTAQCFLHWKKIGMFENVQLNFINEQHAEFEDEGVQEWHHAYFNILDYSEWLDGMLDVSWQCYGVAYYSQILFPLDEYNKFKRSIDYDLQRKLFEKLVLSWQKTLDSERYQTQIKTLLKSILCLEEYIVDSNKLKEMLNQIKAGQFSASLAIITKE